MASQHPAADHGGRSPSPRSPSKHTVTPCDKPAGAAAADTDFVSPVPSAPANASVWFRRDHLGSCGTAVTFSQKPNEARFSWTVLCPTLVKEMVSF
jgi:hypothetical protein